VLVRAGTWTASALSPTAGVLINLTAAGVLYIKGEKGSIIVYDGAYAGELVGLYRSSLSTILNSSFIEGIAVQVSNSLGNASGYKNCRNLLDCSGLAVSTLASTGMGVGFSTSYNLVSCSGEGRGLAASGSRGFYLCKYLSLCKSASAYYGSATIRGFSECHFLSACESVLTGAAVNLEGFESCRYVGGCSSTVSGGTTKLVGFSSCQCLSGCLASITVAGSASGYGYSDVCKRLNNCESVCGGGSTGDTAGFYNSSFITNCDGGGQNSGAGAGYGFNACKGMGFNHCDAYKTAKYNLSYADSGTSNACADTAAGGYNS
jgi:hypothetical protein